MEQASSDFGTFMMWKKSNSFHQQLSSFGGNANHLLANTRKLSVWLLRPLDETRVTIDVSTRLLVPEIVAPHV